LSSRVRNWMGVSPVSGLADLNRLLNRQVAGSASRVHPSADRSRLRTQSAS